MPRVDHLSQEEIAAIGRDDRTAFSIDEQALIAYTRAVARGRVIDALGVTIEGGEAGAEFEGRNSA